MERADPDSSESAALIAELSETLRALTGDDGRSSFSGADRGTLHFALARNEAGMPVGCGALRPIDRNCYELKRMYARPGTKGVGGAILSYLQTIAAQDGARRLVLSTRRVNERAVAFYSSHGFSECAPFGHYVGRTKSICMEKWINRQN